MLRKTSLLVVLCLLFGGISALTKNAYANHQPFVVGETVRFERAFVCFSEKSALRLLKLIEGPPEIQTDENAPDSLSDCDSYKKVTMTIVGQTGADVQDASGTLFRIVHGVATENGKEIHIYILVSGPNSRVITKPK